MNCKFPADMDSKTCFFKTKHTHTCQTGSKPRWLFKKLTQTSHHTFQRFSKYTEKQDKSLQLIPFSLSNSIMNMLDTWHKTLEVLRLRKIFLKLNL